MLNATSDVLEVKPSARPSGSNSKGLFFLSSYCFHDIYGPGEVAAIASRIQLAGPPLTQEIDRATPSSWPGVEMIFSGWGMGFCDSYFLDRFPDLKIVFYGAGSIRPFITDEFWERGIRITTASAVNAIPVSEFALSQILYSLKQGWQQSLAVKRLGRYPDAHYRPAGAYGSVVGLISLGMIGQLVREKLRYFDVKVLAYDPLISPEYAADLGVHLVSLEELFASADVVSCHTPWLKETERMLRAEHFSMLKPGATFINTARGAVVDELGMISVLEERPDLVAVLDVTYPEPPVRGSPLYTLPNVVITPHISGSAALECRRMGRTMVEELDRYLSHEPLQHEIERAHSAVLA